MEITKILVLLVFAWSTSAGPYMDPEVLNIVGEGGRVDILISLANCSTAKVRSNVKEAYPSAPRPILNQAIFAALKHHMRKCQAPVLDVLNQLMNVDPFIIISPFWVDSKIGVEAVDSDCVSALVDMSEIEEIVKASIVTVFKPGAEYGSDISDEYYSRKYYDSHRSPAESEADIGNQATDDAAEADRAQSGIKAVEAPYAWSQGFRGEGVVVGTIDSGVRVDHEALAGGFRREKGWFDAIGGRLVPYDDHGHGTHVTGIICGRANGIGVAPAAEWIACKAVRDDGKANSIAAIKCGEWMACPTEADGSEPNCGLAPHVVSNSWGGGQGNRFFDGVLATWADMGIFPVFAGGNMGDATHTCGTVVSPGDSPSAIAVGAVNEANSLADFSSVGPATDGSLKPDIVAPGVNVLSAWNSGPAAYEAHNGTSMATPHVSGVVALLLSRSPNLTPGQIRGLLTAGAQPTVPTGGTCGGISDGTYPNNHVGYGRVSARGSFQA